MSNRPVHQREKHRKAVLWKYLNRHAGYIILFVQIRWSINSGSPTRSFILRFDRKQVPTVLSILLGVREAARALKVLKHLESSCPRILPNLDSYFWSALTDTVTNSPSNYVYLNLAIRRCLQCV